MQANHIISYLFWVEIDRSQEEARLHRKVSMQATCACTCVLQGRWARFEEELAAANAKAEQVLSMEEGKASKQQIFSR